MDTSKFQRSIAVIIGINSYQGGIPVLKTPLNDAKTLTEVLRKHHGYTAYLAMDKVATRDNLITLLEKTLPAQVTEHDRLLFYFAGHGIAINGDDGPAGYLIPQDAKLGAVETYLPMSQVHDALVELPCRHFLGILDCCFAGSFRWSSTRKIVAIDSGVLHKERFDRFIQDPAWQMITSAAYDQEALDAFNLKALRREETGEHSPFAAALIDALAGEADLYPPAEPGKQAGDGVVTATELYAYLRDRVETETETHAIRQTPGIHPLNKHDKGEYIFLTPGHPLNLPPAPPLDDSQNPYRGLEVFEESHSELFFGRHKLTQDLVKLVRSRPLTIALGASGSGKSSLIRAGLIPALKQAKDSQWHILSPIRPGDAPFEALNSALGKENLPAVERKDPKKSLAQSVALWQKDHPNARLLLFIDQTEELVTLCTHKEERHAFFQQILEAVKLHRRQLRIVLSLRSDFEPQIREAGLSLTPEVFSQIGKTMLKNRWQKDRFIVPAMTRAELREAIEKPAEARVMYFQPHDLVESLIDEVADMPGALPLLSFALRELYLEYLKRQKVAKEKGVVIERSLTQDDYQEIGGVIQSLTRRADEEFQALVQENPAYGQVIRQVMLRMVAMSGSELTRRRVTLSELEYPTEKNRLAEEVIKQFGKARLLVGGKDDKGKPYIEPAHDALVNGWGTLVAWQREAEESLVLQRRLTPAAEEWQTQKKARFLWHANPRLDLLKQELAADNSWLNKLETEFITQSIRRKSFNMRLYFGIALSVIAGLSLLSIWALREQRQAVIGQIESSRQAADTGLQSNELTLDTIAQSLQAVNAGQHWLLRAQPPERALQTQVLATLRNAVYLNREQARKHVSADETVRAIFMGQASNRLLFTQREGQIACIQDLDGDLIGELQCHELPDGIELLTAAKFSPDGQKIAWATGWNPREPDARGLYVWDWENQEFYRRSVSADQFDFSLDFDFSPDSESLVFIRNAQDEKSSISDWDWKNDQISSRVSFQGAIAGFEFEPNGNLLIATADMKKNEVLSLWKREGATWERSRKLPIGFSDVHRVVVSPIGNSVVMTYGGGRSIGATHELWGNSDTPVVLGSISTAAYTPDGSRIAIAKDDGTIQLFSPALGPPTELKGHKGLVSSLSFSDDGKQLLTAGSDGTIRLWNTEKDGQPLTADQVPNQRLQNPVQAISFSPDSQKIATLEAGTINLRSVSSPQQSLKHFSEPKFSEESQLFFHPQREQLVIAEPTGQSRLSTLHFLDLGSGEVSSLSDEYELAELSFSPDGEELAIFEDAGTDGDPKSNVRLLNLATKQERTIEDVQRPSGAIWKERDQLLGAVSAGAADSVDIWDLTTNQQLASLTIGRSAHRYLSQISFSRDSNLAVLQIAQRTTLWDWQNNLSIELFPGSEDMGEIKSSKISPDGSILAIINEQETVELFQLGKLEDLTERGCDQIRSYLESSPNFDESDRNLCDGVAEAS